MSPSPPFIDRGTGTVDTTEVIAEAIPLAKLIGVFVALALVPSALAFLALGNSTLGVMFTILAQFVLAVGAGITLMYVIARGMQLAE